MDGGDGTVIRVVPKGQGEGEADETPKSGPEIQGRCAGTITANQRDHRQKAGEVLALKTIEPYGLNAVDVKGEWEVVKMAVDSGATETAMGEDMLEGTETRIGAAARRGVEYEIANGVTTPTWERRVSSSKWQKAPKGRSPHKYAKSTKDCSLWSKLSMPWIQRHSTEMVATSKTTPLVSE